MKKFYSFVLHDDVKKYRELLKRVDSYTVYHEPKFLLAEEKAEESPVNIFVYDDGVNIALLPSIKRNIGAIDGLENFSGYYDLKTPHEYSAVLASEQSAELYAKFFNALDEYCHDENIIFQFIRFNPYRQKDSEVAVQCGYNVALSNQQTYIDLEDSAENIFANYSSHARRDVRVAMRKKLYGNCILPTNDNVEIFRRLYVLNMQRLNAKKFFYFNAEYFSTLLTDNDFAKLIFVKHAEEVIAAAILLFSKNFAYYHLSCFNYAFAKFCPMDYLIHSCINISKSYQKKILHLGGGSSTLKKFKQKFSNHRVNYYIAHKIFDVVTYQKICDEYLKIHDDADINFMPLYRGECDKKVIAPPRFTVTIFKTFHLLQERRWAA